MEVHQLKKVSNDYVNLDDAIPMVLKVEKLNSVNEKVVIGNQVI